MSVLTNEDREVDRQPSLTILSRVTRQPAPLPSSRVRRAGGGGKMISRTQPSTDSDEPPLGSTLKSAQDPNSCELLLTAREAANFLRLSLSWLAKTRMRGDGPPYVKLGRTVRYREGALVQWLKSRARLSTSER